MIRGAIEVAQRTRVAGWIYSATEPLRGKTVLAFVAGRCVGSGEVDGFRKDLLDAKLGDGLCGFDFPVRLAEGESVGALIVRLKFSDVALLQPGCRILGSADADLAEAHADLGAIPPASLSWMLDRGMLEQQGYDFLKAIHTVGAYEHGLRAPKRPNDRTGDVARPRLEPEMLVRNLASLLMMAEMQVARTRVASLPEITALSEASPILALWSEERGRISLAAGSHLAGRRGSPPPTTEPPSGGTNFPFGPDRLLFVHRDCSFAARGPVPASGFVVFTAAIVRHETDELDKPAMRVA